MVRCWTIRKHTNRKPQQKSREAWAVDPLKQPLLVFLNIVF